MIVFVCFLIAIWAFWIYMILIWCDKVKEFNQKLEIQKKLIESIQEKMDLHNL